MKNHRFYRIINIIILPLSAYIGINMLMLIFASLTNPLWLLFEFIVLCIPLYAFTANYFYNRSIKLKQHSKPSLKEFIKVNAYVSIFFSVFMFFVCLGAAVIMSNPAALKDFIGKMQEASFVPVSKEQILQTLKFLVYLFLPFSILLMVHVIITLRLLKRYAYFFTDPKNNSSE